MSIDQQSTQPPTKRRVLQAFIAFAQLHEADLKRVHCGLEAHLLETARLSAEQTLTQMAGGKAG